MLACEVCGVKSKDVQRHIVLAGVWSAMCDQCWQEYRQPVRLLKTEGRHGRP